MNNQVEAEAEVKVKALPSDFVGRNRLCRTKSEALAKEG